VILQLIERGSLLGRDAQALFGSLANLARRLAESIRNVRIPPTPLIQSAPPKSRSESTPAELR